jgi:hypothetical protein
MEVNLTMRHSSTPYTGYLKYFNNGVQSGPTIHGIYDPNALIPYDIFPLINTTADWDVQVKAYYKPLRSDSMDV